MSMIDEQPTRNLPMTDEWIGQYLGEGNKYKLTQLLGSGGTGTVYRAHQTGLERDVAIKLLNVEVSRTEKGQARFIREVQTLATLDHPNIVTLLDYGEKDFRPYFVMPLFEGSNLRHPIGEMNLTLSSAEKIFRQIAQSIQYAHDRGIVHRDLKPENVLLKADFSAHLGDFGLAKLLEEISSQTSGSLLQGTPAYIAPERWSGMIPSEKLTDVYSLGVILFELLTGQTPFIAKTNIEMMNKHLNTRPTRIKELRPDLDDDLQGILDKALEKKIRRGATSQRRRWPMPFLHGSKNNRSKLVRLLPVVTTSSKLRVCVHPTKGGGGDPL